MRSRSSPGSSNSLAPRPRTAARACDAAAVAARCFAPSPPAADPKEMNLYEWTLVPGAERGVDRRLAVLHSPHVRRALGPAHGLTCPLADHGGFETTCLTRTRGRYRDSVIRRHSARTSPFNNPVSIHEQGARTSCSE